MIIGERTEVWNHKTDRVAVTQHYRVIGRHRYLFTCSKVEKRAIFVVSIVPGYGPAVRVHTVVWEAQMSERGERQHYEVVCQAGEKCYLHDPQELGPWWDH